MKRKKWSNENKFKIVIAGMQGYITLSELCNHYEIHQSQYYRWRDQFLKEGANVFESSHSNKREEQLKKKMHKMERVIGELTLELKKTIS